MSQIAKDTEKLRVFISYSRDDLDFADQLDTALALHGYATVIDRHGIAGGEEWQRRLGNLIRDADTIAFVLSPASAKSEICSWEVGEAVRLGKRIIPVLCRPLDGTSPPPQLRDLNYIFFYPEPKSPGSGWGSGLARLVPALDTDLERLREHTRYLQRASEWNTGGRPLNRLLSGADIGLAKAWATQRPGIFDGRGRCHEVKGNKDAAIADYRKALELIGEEGSNLDDYQKFVDNSARERLAALGAPAPAAAAR